MCPTKTENLALNVAREEAAFWRRAAFEVKARSRGDFQKLLLLIGLEHVSPERAAVLKEIRRRQKAVVLLVLFLALLCSGERLDFRRARSGRRRSEENAEMLTS